MFKTAFNMLVGALIASAVSYAVAVTGNPPGTGFQSVDGAWLNGLANGNNFSNQSGITAAGTTAATATPINPNIALLEVDTVASSTGVLLPYGSVPDWFMLRNAGANTLTVYVNTVVNPATGVLDTVNGTTSISVSSNKSIACFVGKPGAYSCVLSS